MKSFLLAALLVQGLPTQGPERQTKVPIQDLTATPEAPETMGDAEAPEWMLFNRVEVIVNEDIITHRDVLRDIRRFQAQGLITTEAELREAETRVFERRIRELLEVQAGQDLGLPEDVMLRNVESVMEREVEDAGGVTALAEDLKRSRTDSSERRERWAERLYSVTWNRIVTGEQPGASGRPTEDRYVRPGMRRFVHRTVLESPTEYARFGGISPSVIFRLLIVQYQAAGGRGAAREFAAELQKSASEGEDFELLIDNYGALKGDRAKITAEVERLRPIEPELAGFLEDAEVERISPVLTAHLIGDDGRPEPAWGIAKVIERIEAVEPDFAERAVQLKLEEFVEESFDGLRVEAALSQLYRSAFVWPPEFANN